jgi:LacI family transcriptional regulator, galactose operon repressor
MELDRNNPVPLYAQLMRLLKAKCQKTEVGAQLPSERELAAEYGVNRLTVRKAIDELAREGVLSPIHGKGTFISPRGSDASKMPNILVLLPTSLPNLISEHNHVFAGLAQGVLDGASDKVNVVIASIPADANETEFCVGRINHPATDGVILLSWSDLEALTRAARTGKKPFVLLNVKSKKWQGMNEIICNDFEGARTATAHLIGLGHKRILYLGVSAEFAMTEQDAANRRGGYQRALADAGIPFDENLALAIDFHPILSEGDREAVKRILADPVLRPSAIFAAGDQVALEVLKFLHEIGLNVPEDISLIGIDDFPESATTVPPLTTVHKPYYEMGWAATKEVLGQFEDGFRVGSGQVLDMTFVERSSCAAYCSKESVLHGSKANA